MKGYGTPLGEGPYQLKLPKATGIYCVVINTSYDHVASYRNKNYSYYDFLFMKKCVFVCTLLCWLIFMST